MSSWVWMVVVGWLPLMGIGWWMTHWTRWTHWMPWILPWIHWRAWISCLLWWSYMPEKCSGVLKWVVALVAATGVLCRCVGRSTLRAAACGASAGWSYMRRRSRSRCRRSSSAKLCYYGRLCWVLLTVLMGYWLPPLVTSEPIKDTLVELVRSN
jgi:hypothetical protein